MKVTTNHEVIEKRAKWAKRIAPLTMLFLIGGLITNFLSINQPEYFRPTLILLALGFISAIISSNLVNNWVREPRADQILSQVLKKFGNDYLLFNYTTPVPHVLLAPDGLYTLVVKNHDGVITAKGRRISRKLTWRRILRLFADEGLGAPITDAESRAKKLLSVVGEEYDTPEEIPPIKPLVLFGNKDVDLTVEETDIPVVDTTGLKAHLREQGKNREISASERKQLAQLLSGEQA